MKIDIHGARVHNLKDVNVSIPKEKLTVVTGLSGSGKSSLAFDTLYAEGQRRYVESLSSYARQFLGRLEKPDVDRIDGLSPAVAIEQRSASGGPRSTVATRTEVMDHLRMLFARIGETRSPRVGRRGQKRLRVRRCGCHCEVGIASNDSGGSHSAEVGPQCRRPIEGVATTGILSCLDEPGCCETRRGEGG